MAFSLNKRISLISALSMAVLFYTIFLVKNYYLTKKLVEEEMIIYRWNQIKFGTTPIFRFAMANKAAGNLVKSISFITNKTECVELVKNNRAIASFGGCYFNTITSEITEGIHSIDHWIFLRTDFDEGNSIVSVLHNPNGAMFDNNGSLISVKPNYILSFRDWMTIVFLEILVLVMVAVYEKYRMLRLSERFNAERIHDIKHINDDNLSIIRKLKREVDKGSLPTVTEILTSYETLIRVKQATSSSSTCKIRSVNLLEILKLVVDSFYFSKDRKKLSYVIPEKNIWVYSDANILIRSFLNLITNAYTASYPNGQVFISLLEGQNHVEVLIGNDGFIKNPKKLIKRGFSSTGSTGLGVPITIESLGKVNTKIHYITTSSKVIASIRLKKVKEESLCLKKLS